MKNLMCRDDKNRFYTFWCVKDFREEDDYYFLWSENGVYHIPKNYTFFKINSDTAGRIDEISVGEILYEMKR